MIPHGLKTRNACSKNRPFHLQKLKSERHNQSTASPRRIRHFSSHSGPNRQSKPTKTPVSAPGLPKIPYHPYVLAMAPSSEPKPESPGPTPRESTPRAMPLEIANSHRRSLLSSSPGAASPEFQNTTSASFPPMAHGGYGSKTATGNLRIFNCKHCQRAFTREEHLTRHILLTHNKLKPYVCGICLRPFSRRDLLLRHAKNLHQGSEMAVLRIRKSCKKAPEDEESEKGSKDDRRMKMSVNMLVS